MHSLRAKGPNLQRDTDNKASSDTHYEWRFDFPNRYHKPNIQLNLKVRKTYATKHQMKADPPKYNQRIPYVAEYIILKEDFTFRSVSKLAK